MTLRSTVFNVRPTAETTLPKTMGRAVWACVLGLVGDRQPEMAKALHDGAGLKPLAVSPLQGPFAVEGGRLRLRPGQDYWFRASSVAPAPSLALKSIEARPPRVVELDRQPFEVVSAGSNARRHPWAGRGSYGDLHDAALREAESAASQLSIEFASPTAFLSQGRAVLWPEPRRVFGSLLRRWRAHAPVPLPDDLEDAFADCLDVDAYELRTRAQRYAKGASRQVWGQQGFVGRCRYRVRRGASESVLRAAHLLARYALFAGVGSRTTAGMGQARRVPENGEEGR